MPVGDQCADRRRLTTANRPTSETAVQADSRRINPHSRSMIATAARTPDPTAFSSRYRGLLTSNQAKLGAGESSEYQQRPDQLDDLTDHSPCSTGSRFPKTPRTRLTAEITAQVPLSNRKPH